MREQGTVAEWNDGRGFGFITPAGGGPRVFVHVSEFPRGQRPTTSDRVTYAVRHDDRNRRRAHDVRYVKRSGSVRPALLTAILGAALFAAVATGLVLLGRLPISVLPAYGVLSLLSYTSYGSDKAAARRGSRRIPESTLHLLDLLGGWPGGLVARQAYRHKTRKQPFRTFFWGTVLINCGVLLLLATDVVSVFAG
ncbi:DUF1294 domain-containing protein [Nocardioides donggukensis]|uniref:DUF1294 domain-containing protein n=1 Tax=Nocardioides donggukensis TaxID=2774019 RepID=A0A927K5L5_9ACTN|nr:DUF1294 domain-containing protein [Nocardioides donggukensis]MBD8871167.1 DUF1294 domain-containing protein [Nocardioides donggukensis]